MAIVKPDGSFRELWTMGEYTSEEQKQLAIASYANKKSSRK